MKILLDEDMAAINAKVEMADALARQVVSLEAEVMRLNGLLNSPELVDFSAAVVREAAHQREKWGSEHDAGKGPNDWIWLVGVLAGRALDHHKEAERLTLKISDEEEKGSGMRFFTREQKAEIRRKMFEPLMQQQREKAVHHCITAAAVLANWHAHVLGLHTGMRPGIDSSSIVG